MGYFLVCFLFFYIEFSALNFGKTQSRATTFKVDSEEAMEK